MPRHHHVQESCCHRHGAALLAFFAEDQLGTCYCFCHVPDRKLSVKSSLPADWFTSQVCRGCRPTNSLPRVYILFAVCHAVLNPVARIDLFNGGTEHQTRLPASHLRSG